MEKKLHYFVRLLGNRPGWPEDMTPAEEEIMGEHFEYLKKLVAEKKVVLAGPVWKPTFGMIILRVDSEAEARAIMADEPSVVKGLHNYEMQEMVLSLLMQNP
jgi:uncharacterized protein